jgi:hypothetical protein
MSVQALYKPAATLESETSSCRCVTADVAFWPIAWLQYKAAFCVRAEGLCSTAPLDTMRFCRLYL